MSNEINDYTRPRTSTTSRTITVSVIVSCTVIALACIAALTIALTAFFLNAPW